MKWRGRKEVYGEVGKWAVGMSCVVGTKEAANLSKGQ